uniref:Uncharacterized protein n=1 Tax=Tetradesmus obliquus TaxID=3088 RepID=A0A383WND0_TETOB|eukprot:jgi/Sobl393_1/13849/SZX78968.1
MAGKIHCALAVFVLGALLLASSAAAERSSDEKTPAALQGTPLSHRRALRLIVESTTGYWFWDTKAETKITLVPASSLHKKPAPAAERVEEKQLSTAHLKDVELPEHYKHIFAKGDATLVPVAVVVEKEEDSKEVKPAGRPLKMI